MDQYAETYKRETYEHLEELESALLALESDIADSELINLIFRKFHTIKGSGGMFGFDDIAEFTHDIETVYDGVRNGEIPVTKRLVDLSLNACDLIKKMVDGEKTSESERVKIKQELAGILPASPNLPANTILTPKRKLRSADSNTYRIRFKPSADLFQNGTNPLPLLDELRGMGECTVVANPANVPDLETISAESCYITWDIILTTDQDENAIRDVFIFVEDNCELSIKLIGDKDFLQEENIHKKLGEILVERGSLSIEDLNAALASQKRLGKVLSDNKFVDSQEIISALKEQEHFTNLKKKHQEDVAAQSIRVPAERLDALVDLVGELVTVQARLSEEVVAYRGTNLVYIAEEIERLTAELREKTMNIRMLPIGTLFTKFKRVVRDLSKELGKSVALVTEGGETELDKRVIEQLNDPMVHLIRNAIDHGIEQPEDRQKTGKLSEGKIRLKALHSGDNVMITIEDDGAGLNPEKIRTKAVEKGLLSKDAVLSDDDLYMYIFAPGFSTASKITNVSGRGVGMDVVKKSLDALQGSVSVTSEKGTGTKITLKVPLTLAIVDGLMVKIGEEDYVFPLSTVEECVEISRKEADKAQKRNMMDLRGKMVSYLSLYDYFQIEGHRPPYEKIIIVESNGKKIGLGVDSVVGKHQTVIKSLGDLYKDIDGLSGATIKGDGTIALVLDVNMLSKSLKQDSEVCSKRN